MDPTGDLVTDDIMEEDEEGHGVTGNEGGTICCMVLLTCNEGDDEVNETDNKGVCDGNDGGNDVDVHLPSGGHINKLVSTMESTEEH